MMTRLEVLSHLSKEDVRMIRLCEASIEDQQLAQEEFGPEYEKSFGKVKCLMCEMIEVLVERSFGKKKTGRALKALRRGRW